MLFSYRICTRYTLTTRFKLGGLGSESLTAAMINNEGH